MSAPKPRLEAIEGGEEAARAASAGVKGQEIGIALSDARLVLGAMLCVRDSIPEFKSILNGGAPLPSKELCETYETLVSLHESGPGLVDRNNLASHLLGKVKNSLLFVEDLVDAFDAETQFLPVALEAAKRLERRHNEALARHEAAKAFESSDPVEALLQAGQRIAAPRRRPFPETQLGVAERFLEDYGSDLLFVSTFGRWFAYDGRRWVEGSEGQARRWAQENARVLYREAAADRTEQRRKYLLSLARKGEEKRAIDATLGLSWPRREADPDVFDRQNSLFNVANGTIDLRTGELRPHEREDRLSKISPVEYDIKASCPRWEDFLAEIFPGDVDMLAFVHRAVGYSLTGDISERRFFMPLGVGRNGKSTFLNAIQRLAGTYAAQADFETFLEQPRTGRRVRDDLASLAGARFVSAVEAGKGRALDTTLIKSLTGGERTRCRHLYGREFEFNPTLKLWLCANHAPRVTDGSEATWDRVLRIPFDVRIEEGKVDKKLPRKLLDELPGILAWAVAGAVAWYQDGLRIPRKVLDANRLYRETEDPLGGFFDDDTCPFRRVLGQKVPLKTVREAYNAACHAEGEEAVGTRSFSAALEEKGFKIAKSGGPRYVYGLAPKEYLGDLGLGESGQSAVSAVFDPES